MAEKRQGFRLHQEKDISRGTPASVETKAISRVLKLLEKGGETCKAMSALCSKEWRDLQMRKPFD